MALTEKNETRKKKTVGPRRQSGNRTTSAADAPGSPVATRKRSPKRAAKLATTAAAKAEEPLAAAVTPEPAAPAPLVTPAERHRLIREVAYRKALRRGFASGRPDEDWLEAEAEVDLLLLRRGADSE